MSSCFQYILWWLLFRDLGQSSWNSFTWASVLFFSISPSLMMNCSQNILLSVLNNIQLIFTADYTLRSNLQVPPVQCIFSTVFVSKLLSEPNILQVDVLLLNVKPNGWIWNLKGKWSFFPLRQYQVGRVLLTET